MPMLRLAISILACLMCNTGTVTAAVYQEPADFVSESFGDSSPTASVLWLKDELKKQVEEILQHEYRGQRIRYWQDKQRSLWILEEIGKKKPITTGIVINHDKIEKIKVLVFRETRGWEVKHPFFTNQFTDARLQDDNKLDRYIDGISGATLSVRALTKLARIALLLHKSIQP